MTIACMRPMSATALLRFSLRLPATHVSSRLEKSFRAVPRFANPQQRVSLLATTNFCRSIAHDNSTMSKVCLIVIDGWGLSDKVEGNAIINATTPVMDAFAKAGPENYSTLDASGLSVGLPEGMMGNSEVGHLNIGAGRVLFQDIVRINKDVQAQRMHENTYFAEACNRAKGKNGRLHLMGLTSDGGVHAHIEHLFALLDGAQKIGVQNVFVHFFGDGRDTRPTSGTKYMQQVIDRLTSTGYGKLSTVVGRYYAMDRDKRWERIQIAFEGLVQGKGEKTTQDKLISVVEGR